MTTGNRMRQRLTDAGDAPGAQHEVDLKLSGRRSGDEAPIVSQFKQKAQDEALGRQIRQLGQVSPIGALTLYWNRDGANCRGSASAKALGQCSAETVARRDRAHEALSAVLSDLLDPLEVRG